MCGIVGAVANRNVVPSLIEGLSRLEYRGYDSAGVAVLNGGIRRVRAVGRVAEMQAKAEAEQLYGLVGIGHTRWATHGGVTELNAHPHISRDEIAVVHNGIIENHDQHGAHLKALGYQFESQTDTEVIAHLIHHHYKLTGDLFIATQHAVRELIGAYAIGAIALKSPDVMTCARMGQIHHVLAGLRRSDCEVTHLLTNLGHFYLVLRQELGRGALRNDRKERAKWCSQKKGGSQAQEMIRGWRKLRIPNKVSTLRCR